MAGVSIELLEKRRDRSSFECGNEELDRYLKTLARQHHELGFAKTYVAVEAGQSGVLGYITVSMGTVVLQNMDEAVAVRLPKHPMPVLRVARLATGKGYAGRGIGSMLLSHAASLALAAADSIGVYALELVASDEEAHAYYLRRGFLPLKGDGMRLYTPLATIRAARGL